MSEIASGAVPLSWLDLALAASLMLAAALLALLLQLGITRSFLVAALRMTVQLLLIGQILTWLFAQASLWLTLAAGALMLLVAGYEVTARQERRLQAGWSYLLGTGTLTLCSTLVLFLALTTQIDVDPWYDPRYAIPLFGMILGNAMTGIALGLNALVARLESDSRGIEAQLLLGASRWQALRPSLRQALRSGFMPIVNSMAATGVVALPGMMTGQILAGADPTQAVKYQLLVMFLIAGATSLGVVSAVMATAWRVTDNRDRLRLDRLRRQ
ncbi:MAG: iron export ABC transporter permease subunit FetB [Rhodospirillales bacterium]